MLKKCITIISLTLSLAMLGACAQMIKPHTTVIGSPVIDRIMQQGVLVVGTAGTMPPLNMTTKEKKIIGFEIDIAEYMAAAMGVELRIEAMPFSQLMEALESGSVDMVLSGMTITGERNLQVAFVGPYFISGKSFLTKQQTIANAQKASEVNSPEWTLAALKGSTSQAFVEKAIPKANLVVTSNYDEAVAMVLNDKADALVADHPICMVSVMRYPGKGLIAILTRLTYEPIGIAISAGDPLLVNWVENFLNTLEGDGLLAKLKKRWFKSDWWLVELP